MALGADQMVVVPGRPLLFEQRNRLQEIFDDPVFRQAWNNVQACKPTLFPVGLDTALGAQIGNNRLHQLQGWELFRTALLRQVIEPKPAPAKPSNNFPDAGTRDAELQAQIAAGKTKP